MMLPADYVISALADLMFVDQEDGTPGMLARGLLVRNRVNAGWHGGSWLKNIEDFNPESFSAPDPSRVVKLGDPYRDKLFVHVLSKAAAIYEGREGVGKADPIEGALWSAKLNECSADFASKIVRAQNSDGQPVHPRIATVGKRQFFK